MLFFGGAYFCRGSSEGVLRFKMPIGLDNNVSLKQRQQPKIAAHPNSPWAYMREGVLSEGQYVCGLLWGLIFGRAYYQNYTVCCLREREVTSLARIEKNSCNSQSLRWFLTTIVSIPTHNKRMHTAPQVGPGCMLARILRI